METPELQTTPLPLDKAKPLRGIGNMLMMGTSFAGGGAIVLAAFELIRAEPDRAFRLLQTWGPGFILVLFIAWAIQQLVGRALDIAERVGGRIADAMESQSVSLQGQALAIQQSADKDDRQVQEMQTLTALTAQRSEKTYAMMQSYHEDNQMILKSQAETLARIEKKVDAKIAAEEIKTT